jgi:hypothetical protein
VRYPEAFHNSPLSLLALIATVVSVSWFLGYFLTEFNRLSARCQLIPRE